MIGDMYPFSTRRYILFFYLLYTTGDQSPSIYFILNLKSYYAYSKKKKNKKKEKNMLMQSRSSLFVSNSYNHASRHAYDIYI